MKANFLTQVAGIGTDILSVNRFSCTLDRFRERFLLRVFTDCEMDYCLARSQKQSVLSLVARFCVKEATFKALRVRIGYNGFGFKDVFIKNELSGSPCLCFSKRLKKWVREERNVVYQHVSLSHCNEFVQAFVVLESVVRVRS